MGLPRRKRSRSPYLRGWQFPILEEDPEGLEFGIGELRGDVDCLVQVRDRALGQVEKEVLAKPAEGGQRALVEPELFPRGRQDVDVLEAGHHLLLEIEYLLGTAQLDHQAQGRGHPAAETRKTWILFEIFWTHEMIPY